MTATERQRIAALIGRLDRAVRRSLMPEGTFGQALYRLQDELLQVNRELALELAAPGPDAPAAAATALADYARPAAPAAPADEVPDEVYAHVDPDPEPELESAAPAARRSRRRSRR